jgi:predicted dehydrogenase
MPCATAATETGFTASPAIGQTDRMSESSAAPSVIRWGIAGPGRIAESVAGDFPQVPGAELTAVGSRSLERAEDFAGRHGATRAYGSYSELMSDAEVDVIYIATPHPQHHGVAVAALRAGKGVLVEKAFTATVAGAQDIVSTAHATGGFAMEAMWTRFQPAIVRLRELVADDAIGTVLSVQADLGVVKPYDPTDRLYDPALGGGAVLDLGVYVVSFAQMVLGTPHRVEAVGTIGPSGVEIDAAILLGFPSGATATLSTSLHSPMPGQARVFGTKGWIDVLPRFHHPDQIVLHRVGVDPETITAPHIGGGYAHELIEVTECIRAGRDESAVMPLADSVAVQEVLNEVLGQLGIHPAEAENVV